MRTDTPRTGDDERHGERLRPVNRDGGRRDGGETLAKWMREETRRRERAEGAKP